jgi:hypothetical protein
MIPTFTQLQEEHSSLPLTWPAATVQWVGRLIKGVCNTIAQTVQKITQLALSFFKKPANESSGSPLSTLEQAPSLTDKAVTSLTILEDIEEAEQPEEIEIIIDKPLPNTAPVLNTAPKPVDSYNPKTRRAARKTRLACLQKFTGLFKTQKVTLPKKYRSTATTSAKIVPYNPISTWNGLVIQDMPSDGNCQLHAIKSALALKYPTHAMQASSIDELRQLGVKFSQDYLSQNPPPEPHDDIFTYMRADIDEINEISAMENRKKYYKLIAPLTAQMESLKNNLKNKKIDASTYAAQIQPVEEQKTQFIESQDEELHRIGIQTIDEYLDALKKDAFWCGQLHLHALSASLKLPIHVHSHTAPGQVTVFNPHKISSPPLELLRVQDHYRLILGKQEDFS